MESKLSDNLTVGPYIHRKVVVMREDHDAYDAARAMCENRIGCVLVSDSKKAGHIKGILTDRDIVCELIAAEYDIDTRISNIMTTEVVSVDEGASLENVIELMKANGIRRVPVINKHNGHERCVGIVTLDDLIVSGIIGLDALKSVVRSQVRNRISRHSHESSSNAHMIETLQKFYNRVSQALGVNEYRAIQISKAVLSAFVKRVHYTSAVHLISQLPHLIQEDLYDLPAGPDRLVTREQVIKELSESLGLTSEGAAHYIRIFIGALEKIVGRGELGHLKAQLPKDLQEFFSEDKAA